jgi:hypothetical protein
MSKTLTKVIIIFLSAKIFNVKNNINIFIFAIISQLGIFFFKKKYYTQFFNWHIIYIYNHTRRMPRIISLSRCPASPRTLLRWCPA